MQITSRIFLVYRAYNLALCAPVSVAKNERSSSRIEIVKNFKRSKCGDDRLDSVILLYCEADIAMELNLDSLVDNLANIRHRRIEILRPTK